MSGIRHGLRYSPIYDNWSHMMKRCTNKRYRDYPDWGGRGITICERWMSFLNFHEDMFPSWRPGLTLERINNNGNYEPGNCKWATRKEQSNNTRQNRFVQYAGKSLTVSQWADLRGINRLTLNQRLIRGWTAGEALEFGVRHKHDRKLDMDSAIEIRRRFAAGETQQDIAKDFSVDPSRISKVVSNKVWPQKETN